MEQIAGWLKKLGMSQYTDRFVENRIDESIIELTDQDLKDLGVVSLGHRRKMLRAIRDLSGASIDATAPAATIKTEPTRRDDAERRQLTVMFIDLAPRRGCPREMTETRKLAAILAADVVGYSRLAIADEDWTLVWLRPLRSDLINPTIAVHHGRVVKHVRNLLALGI